MNAKEILLATVAMVEADPKTWIKGAAARDDKGDLVDSESPKAVCWCAIGFTEKFGREDFEAKCAARATLRGLTEGNIATFNDEVINTPEEFIAWFRKAADLL